MSAIFIVLISQITCIYHALRKRYYITTAFSSPGIQIFFPDILKG